MIEATGQQWIWRYEYPDGTFSYYELVVPVDTAIVVKLGSTDVVHRWWVPGLGGKFDAVPDQSNQTWFKADEEGSYDGASYQFSGASYAAMRTRVQALSVPEYEAWLDRSGRRASRRRRTSSRRRSRPTPSSPTPTSPTRRARSERRRQRPSVPGAAARARHRRASPAPTGAGSRLATSTDHKDVGRMFIAAALVLPRARVCSSSC